MSKNRDHSQKKKKGFADVLISLFLVLAIGVFCYAGYNLITIYLEYKKGSDEYSQIAQMAVKERNPDEMPEAEEGIKAGEDGGTASGENTGNSTLVPPISVDFASLQAVNDDVNGWIYVEAVSDIINYPVVRGSDNSYYLHNTYQGTYNFAGTIFVDYENRRDFSDCNTLVYGHNMKNGSMFAQLKLFTTDAKTFQRSRYFWMFTPEAAYRYEIISAYTTAVDGDTYTLFKGPGEEFLEWEKKMVTYSQIPDQPTVNTDVFTAEDKVITLSTCTGDYSTRYVVQGRRVDTVPIT